MLNSQNIFLRPFTTVHQMTPFDKIQNSYYEEAVDAGIAEQRAEIAAITGNADAPTFANTIVALERSGATLDRVLNVFYPLLEANSSPELMEISQRIAKKTSDWSTEMSLNEALWQRIKTVYDHRAALNLDTEDSMLLQNTYDGFARSGALLQGTDRERYKQLSTRLSELTLQFGQNVLKEQNLTEMWLTKDDLEGIPEATVEAYALAAKNKGREGEYLVTVSYPSYAPFMKFSARADLREKLYKMNCSRNTKGEYSNIEVMKEISLTRMQIANLLGYKTYSEYVLARRMAENPTNVYNLLNRLRDAYMPVWEKEKAELTEFATAETGKAVTLNAWDYSYWANRLKSAKYAFDDEQLRPYFMLDNVIEGVFGLATRLYGLHFTYDQNIIVFHPEVRGYNVTDADGNFVGILYTDFHPRESKRSGAWMTEFRPEEITESGDTIHPHITLTMNFTKPTATKPALLSFSEVETFLHEFGHAIHGLLAATKYKSMSGTSVYRDFVEFPSQFNENFLRQKEYVDGFARHYETGEPMPQELLDKMIAAARFGVGYACLRQLGFGYIDMAWHDRTAPVTDTYALEYDALKQVATFPAVEGCVTSPQFNHIFSGGYASGYYSYKWSEMLDSDAFSVFLRNGIFDPATAKSFKDNILTRGGTEHPMTLYKRFRGQEPTIDALLERDGVPNPGK